MKTLDYTSDENTAALKLLKRGIDSNGERIPRTKREAAIRLLHKLPAAGRLTLKAPDTHWTARGYLEDSLWEATAERRRAERRTQEPVSTSTAGPEHLSDLLRMDK